MRQQQRRHPHSGRRAEQGYVLVIVMGLLAILGVMSFSLRAATRTSLEQTRHLQDDIAAEFLSKAGIDWVIHYLHRIERQDTMWQAPWATQASTFHDHKLGPGVFHIGYRDSTSMWRHGLQDEEARLNVNNAPVSALAALPGLSPEQAQAIVTARQLTRWNAPEELVQRGFITQERWSGTADSPGLEHDLTVWGSGKVNVNTASPVVLATLPGSTPALVAALIRYRQGPDQQLGTTDDQSFRTLHDVARAPGIDPKALERIRPLLTVTPSAFRFIATGYIARQGVQAHIHRRFAVLERTPQATALRYWRRVE